MINIALKLFTLFFLFSLANTSSFSQDWKKLDGAPTFRGKQDDIYFVNEKTGWYVNGSGKIYKTTNGGTLWKQITDMPGTFFRCIGFIDTLVGFVGNIGTEYFPNVKDTTPLYKTKDGGNTWIPVSYRGPVVKGLCAIDIIPIPYVNHGVLSYKHKVIAGGRVGNPAYLLVSEDDGNTFTSKDMNPQCAFILDIKFLNEDVGFIAAGTNKSVDKSNGLILKTKDGGKTWKKVYQSSRSFEITWKASFPTKRTGYVTLQSYNPDTTKKTRYIVKTTNGGKKWKELPITNDHTIREFGVGFISENKGWVGTNKWGYETRMVVSHGIRKILVQL
jgi:photosystem II stability/assembly factor-like uncharacterized protein